MQVKNEFATPEEIAVLLGWASAQRDKLHANSIGPGRFSAPLAELDADDTVKAIQSRVEAEFGFTAEQTFTMLPHYLSFNEEGAFIHQHKDLTDEGKIHYRVNVMVAAATEGGNVLIEGQAPVRLEDGDAYLIEASEVVHGTTTVVGTKPRIVLSFGYVR